MCVCVCALRFVGPVSVALIAHAHTRSNALTHAYAPIQGTRVQRGNFDGGRGRPKAKQICRMEDILLVQGTPVECGVG